MSDILETLRNDIQQGNVNLYGETLIDLEKTLNETQQNQFNHFIHTCMKEGCHIIEAIESYCNEYEVDIEDIVHLIDAQTRDKIKNYAVSNNLLRNKENQHLEV